MRYLLLPFLRLVGCNESANTERLGRQVPLVISATTLSAFSLLTSFTTTFAPREAKKVE